MTKTIAVSGKGGVGKTTISAMIVRELIGRGNRAVLAVDADPNACLGLTLGTNVLGEVSDLREDARSKNPSNAGIDRLSSFEYGLQQIITEADGYDLVGMGRPEGPSCYCAANNLLRKFLDKLSNQYSFVVLDNEAGMEHLSRRTTNNVDLMLIVGQPTPIGEVTARRIAKMTNDLPITVKKVGVVWNAADEGRDVEGVDSFGIIPQDKAVIEACMAGKSIFDIDENSPALVAVREILQKELEL